jgi:hypothetical protein
MDVLAIIKSFNCGLTGDSGTLMAYHTSKHVMFGIKVFSLSVQRLIDTICSEDSTKGCKHMHTLDDSQLNVINSEAYA